MDYSLEFHWEFIEKEDEAPERILMDFLKELRAMGFDFCFFQRDCFQNIEIILKNKSHKIDIMELYVVLNCVQNIQHKILRKEKILWPFRIGYVKGSLYLNMDPLDKIGH